MYGCKKWVLDTFLKVKYKMKIKLKDNTKHITDLCSMLV